MTANVTRRTLKVDIGNNFTIISGHSFMFFFLIFLNFEWFCKNANFLKLRRIQEVHIYLYRQFPVYIFYKNLY